MKIEEFYKEVKKIYPNSLMKYGTNYEKSFQRAFEKTKKLIKFDTIFETNLVLDEEVKIQIKIERAEFTFYINKEKDFYNILNILKQSVDFN